MFRRTFIPSVLSVLALVAGCRSVDVQQTTVMNGVVETVDPASRELLLRGQGGAQSGALLSMIVGPQVQRLDQIRPGNRVTVTYYQALAAQVVNVFSPQSQPFEGVILAAQDAWPGSAPLIHASRACYAVVGALASSDRGDAS